MRFRDSIALNTCPLLLRLVLAVTFLWAGIPKFNPTTFQGDAAATLVRLGIGEKTVIAGQPPVETKAENTQPVEPKKVEPPVEESPDSAQPPAEQPSSEAAPANDAGGDEVQPTGSNESTGTPAEQPTEQPAEPAAKPKAEQPAKPVEKPQVEKNGEKTAANVQYEVKARQVESITIMLDGVGHPYPHLFAWIAMATEIVGGALILVGLFSRVWGLGLAVAMGYAFALSTLPAIHDQMVKAGGQGIGGFLNGFASCEYLTQTAGLLQLALFVAAWCIFIGGPGAASLDRLIFRGGHSDD